MILLQIFYKFEKTTSPHVNNCSLQLRNQYRNIHCLISQAYNYGRKTIQNFTITAFVCRQIHFLIQPTRIATHFQRDGSIGDERRLRQQRITTTTALLTDFASCSWKADIYDTESLALPSTVCVVACYATVVLSNHDTTTSRWLSPLGHNLQTLIVKQWRTNTITTNYNRKYLRIKSLIQHFLFSFVFSYL